MTGPAQTREPIFIAGEQYFKTESGLMVNVSELIRIYQAVNAAIKPGMSEADIDALISATIKRMSPN